MLHKLPLGELQETVAKRCHEYGFPFPTPEEAIARLHLEVTRVYQKALQKGGFINEVDFPEGPAGLAPDSIGLRMADLMIMTLIVAERFKIELPNELEVRMNYHKSLAIHRARLREEAIRKAKEEAEMDAIRNHATGEAP